MESNMESIQNNQYEILYIKYVDSMTPLLVHVEFHTPISGLSAKKITLWVIWTPLDSTGIGGAV